MAFVQGQIRFALLFHARQRHCSHFALPFHSRQNLCSHFALLFHARQNLCSHFALLFHARQNLCSHFALLFPRKAEPLLSPTGKFSMGKKESAGDETADEKYSNP